MGTNTPEHLWMMGNATQLDRCCHILSDGLRCDSESTVLGKLNSTARYTHTHTHAEMRGWMDLCGGLVCVCDMILKA